MSKNIGSSKRTAIKVLEKLKLPKGWQAYEQKEEFFNPNPTAPAQHHWVIILQYRRKHAN